MAGVMPSRWTVRVLSGFPVALVSVLACSSPSAGVGDEVGGAAAAGTSPSSQAGSTPGGSSAQGGGPSQPPTSCRAPDSVSARPSRVADVVALVNALPHPLSLACFIEALEPPLQLYATESFLSAQPAVGPQNPRVFIYLGNLLVSVVPAGIGMGLLEMGETRPERLSLKAELPFPVEAPISPTLPFTHVVFNENISNCAFCHAFETTEQLDVGVPGFVSERLRPEASERVPLSMLKDELSRCQAGSDVERCDLLRALVGHVAPLDWEFPTDLDTF